MSAPDNNANLLLYIKRRRRRRIAAIALVVVLAAVPIAVLVSGRTFDLAVTPERAAASASWQRADGTLLSFGSRIVLFSERGAITIGAEGFAPLTLAINKNSEYRQIEAALEPLPGLASITVTSQSDFKLFVDETAHGSTAQIELELRRGTHSVRIEGAGIKPIRADIDINGYGETQRFDFNTEPGNSAFALSTQPADARILLDGQEVGRGAYEGFVELGDREISIERAGYHNQQLRFTAEPDKRVELGLIELSPKPASLSVTSTPGGAAVLINGDYSGTTPVRLSLAPLRSHRLVIRKTGYEPLESHLELKPGERFARNFELGSTTYKAQVTADIEARVTINGVAQGSTPASVTVRAGDRIAVSRAGYQTQSAAVDPVGGERRVYQFTMMRPNDYAFQQAPLEETVANRTVLRKFPPVTFRIPTADGQDQTRAKQLTRPFYLGVREVTYGEYRAFAPRPIPRGLTAQHPVANLSWGEAARFCNWLSEQNGLAPVYEFDDSGGLRHLAVESRGYRLPTEAEWESVSGYDFSAASAVGPYPWGHNSAIPRAFANIAGREAQTTAQGKFLFDHVDNHARAAPVGSYAANVNGVFDLAGNVAEWVTDYHAPRPNPVGTPLVDPLGPTTGLDHLVKGSSFRSHALPALAIAHRTLVAGQSDDVGFRVARWIY